VELTHLQSFAAVYRHSSITRAAEELHVSQPSVTAHLRALEAELRRPLFVRLARGVRATPLADRLAREINAPLESLIATSQGFHHSAEITEATLLLGGPADVLSEVILPTLAPLVAQGLSIRVRTGLTADLIASLADGELDVVIATTPTRQRSVTLRPLFDETLALVASHTLAARLSKQSLPTHGIAWPAVLSEYPLVAFAENAPLVRRYWRTVFGLSSAPKPRVVIDDLRAIIRTVTSTAAWTVVPTYLIRQHLDRGDLIVLHEPPEPPTNTLYVATRSDRSNPTITARVVELLQSARL
jgi:DNA-binding transcriptional LysR family regulator